MCPIGDAASGLEKRGASFTVESLAKELRQEWVEEALRATGRESVRVRLLPATLTMWLVVLMGLYRRTSCVNLLEKLPGALVRRNSVGRANAPGTERGGRTSAGRPRSRRARARRQSGPQRSALDAR